MSKPITWTNDQICLGALKPWENNPRYSTEQQAERIADSHRMFGQVETIAIGPDGSVYNGHQRLSAWLAEYGPDYVVDVRRCSRKLKDDERQALTAMLHAGAVGSWDFDTLANWDSDILQGFGFDEDLLKGWQKDTFALGDLLASEDGGGEGSKPDDTELIDKAEELQQKWQVQQGDIFQMGEHLVICGDCREPETWARLLTAAKVDKANGIFTSPPYAEQRKKQYGGVPTAKYVEWWEAVQSNVRANLAEDGSFFVNIKPHCEGGQRVLYVFDLVLAMVRQWGWQFVDELCWKTNGVFGGWPNRFKNGFEPIYQFSMQKDIKFNKLNVLQPFAESSINRIRQSRRSGEINDGRKYSKTGSNFNTDWGRVAEISEEQGGALPSNVIDISAEVNAGILANHAAAFPIALPTFFIKAYSDPGDVWLDPFAGSGTVLCACHNENRWGLGIEILPKYTAVICERLERHTSLKPQLVERV